MAPLTAFQIFSGESDAWPPVEAQPAVSDPRSWSAVLAPQGSGNPRTAVAGRVVSFTKSRFYQMPPHRSGVGERTWALENWIAL